MCRAPAQQRGRPHSGRARKAFDCCCLPGVKDEGLGQDDGVFCTRPSFSRAAGELDYVSAGLLHRQVKDARETTQSTGMVLDLSRVTFRDAMGVGVLVLLLKQSREQQRCAVLPGLRLRAIALGCAGHPSRYPFI
ncbi:STAS domain-containing protein [Nonomuraea sp. NN258]|uniref:STAS domain-containing protein n=1 Tax=Nonomuraea antri TaxID=2730852 RepID=UPI001569D04E|nr:STAS domain-containing protein [Nonomuraea antri]